MWLLLNSNRNGSQRYTVAKNLLPQACIATVAIASLLSYSESIMAADWVLEPKVEHSVNYTDNVYLAPDGQEQQEWIVQINPLLAMKVNGRYMNANLNYRMQNIIYVSDNQRPNSIFHQLDAAGKAEIITNKLGLDATADYYQRNSSDQQVTGFDNIAITGKVINSARASLSPYFVYQFDDNVDLNIRYKYSRVDYSGSSVFDSKIGGVNLSVQGSKQDRRLSWQLSGSRTKVNYYSQPDIEFNSAELSTRYILRPRLSLLANAGYDVNNYQQIVGKPEPEGSSWSTGLTWVLGRRSVVTLLLGRHYYGDALSFSFNHRTRHSLWKMEYMEDVVAGSATGIDPYSYSDQFQQVPDADPRLNELNNDAKYNDQFSQVSTAEAYIRKRFSADCLINLRKIRFYVNALYDINQYQLSNVNENILTGSASWVKSLTESTNLEISENGQYIEYRDQVSKGLVQRIKFKLERKANKNMSEYISYSYTSRYANNSIDEYEQNYIQLGLDIQL